MHRGAAVLAACAILFGVGASAAYTVETVATAHNGPMTTSGPAREAAPGGPGGSGPGGWGPGGPGGMESDNPALASLVAGADNRWAAASVGSFTASSLELKTGAPVMALGGFTGSDNSPTLAQFQAYVADREIRYFIAGGEHGGPPRGRSGPASDITEWVKQNFTPIDVGGTTVYDLTAPVAR
jgi:hypothetical protein